LSTMKDVAKLAGVSVATVSCVLSGKRHVRKETRMLVNDAIAKLHFIPSSVARNLKTSKLNEIGVVLTDIDDDINADILKGITSTMQRSGYYLNIDFSNSVAHLESEKLDMLIGKKLAGLIVMTTQSENTAFFKSRILDNNIPTVFLLRKPYDFPCCYVAFNTGQIVYNVASKMLSLGYKNISLVCGDDAFSCESDAIDNFRKAYSDHNRPLLEQAICKTTMSKEDAFKTTVYAYYDDFPEAIISTTKTIAKGLLETAHIYSKKVGRDVTIVSLGDDGWCRANQLGGVIIANVNAVLLGNKAAKLLLDSFSYTGTPANEDVIIGEAFDTDLIPPPPITTAAPSILPSKQTLRILAPILYTTTALIRLSRYFESKHPDTRVVYEQPSTHEEILKTIEKEHELGKSMFDIYMFDVPWLYYIGYHKLLMDITDFVSDYGINIDKMLDWNLRSCVFNYAYYGIPITGGSQLLFYRKDFFENAVLIKDYERQHNLPLRTPRTWAEFNKLCRFFTSKYNPLSPVEYGTSASCALPEYMITTLLPCIWSHGGKLFKGHDRPVVNTPEVKRAVERYLETLDYCCDGYNSKAHHDIAEDFLQERCAMIISFSDYVSSLSAQKNLLGKIGYAMLPGKASVFPGWNFGVSCFTQKKELVFDYLNWASSSTINYYLTILVGQSPHVEPYENNELRRLYPWLSLSEQVALHTKKRLPPVKPDTKVIPQNKIESIVSNIIYDIINNGASIDNSVERAQEKLEMLFSSYGYI